MLQNIFYIIFMLSTFTVYSYGDNISEHNERQLLLSMNSQLSDLKEKLTNEIAKDLDVQLIGMNIRVIRTELAQQKKCVLGKEEVIHLRAELEQQKKNILEKEADNQSLRADIQSLRAELELQKKFVLDKEADNEILRAELERQGKLVDGPVKESDQLNSTSSLRNCFEAKSNGIHDVLIPKFSSQPFKAVCDAETRDGGWTVLLRRFDGSVHFLRDWAAYKNGFGNLDGEFFLGLDKIHAMTAERSQELLVVLEDLKGNQKFETYDEFAIGDESQQYILHTLGNANGTAGDSLTWHLGMQFTTFDKDYVEKDNVSCAILSTGAWWYRPPPTCQASQFTGTYRDNGKNRGMDWYSFDEHSHTLIKAVMMIRPKN